MRGFLLALLVVGLLSATVGAEDKADKLEGKWVVVSVERDGKADDALKGAIREQTADKYTLTPKEAKPVTGSYKIDASKTPKTIDLVPGEGRYKDKTLLGIYQLDGDGLKICAAIAPGDDRPKEFAAKKATTYIVLKREMK